MDRSDDARPEFRVLVTGGRDFADRDKLWRTLDALSGTSMGDRPNPSWLPRPDLVILHGGARGADSLADEWAVTNWVRFRVWKADWERHGRAAGTIRNRKMLEEGKPDLVIAFPGPRSRGTWNMVRLARQSDVAVEVR